MLDDTTALATDTAAALAWHATLAVGDIVSYRFPIAEEDGTAQPKARPCLVLDIETIGDAEYAVLAYGTTAVTAANRGYEIRVRAAKYYRAAGLHKPTRFVGARRLLVPLASKGFVCRKATGSPVLGQLTGEARERMHAVRARIQAEKDIAAARRASHQGRSSRRVRALRPFTVEYRHPKRHASRNGKADR